MFAVTKTQLIPELVLMSWFSLMTRKQRQYIHTGMLKLLDFFMPTFATMILTVTMRTDRCFVWILHGCVDMGLIAAIIQASQQSVLIMLDLSMVTTRVPLVSSTQMILFEQCIYFQCTDSVKLRSFCHRQLLEDPRKIIKTMNGTLLTCT